MKHEILRMENIITYFGGIRLVDHARLNLFKGEILGIAGLNYSGKTALIGGINGLLPYTSGTTYYQEKRVTISSVREANEKGIFYIDPRLNLIPGSSIAENIFLKDNKNRSPFYHARDCKRRAKEVLKDLSLDLSSHSLVRDLTYHDKILISIGKAVANQAKIIILDCILSTVVKKKVNRLQDLFRMLQKREISVILIEQTLKTMKPYCQRVFIMRQGSMAGEFFADEIEDNKVISMMIGRPVADEEAAVSVPAVSGLEEILSFQHVYYNDIVKDLNFQVYRNEITGILNLNKYSGEAIEVLLSGNAIPDQGCIYWKGQSVKLKNTKTALKKGIGMVGETECLCDEMTLSENVLISALTKRKGRLGLIKKSDFKYIKNEVISEYIKRDGIMMEDEALPQGWLMRKKVALCRALAAEPEIMVLINPTQYIDLVSKKEFYKDIVSLKRKQISVLLVSADIEEIIAVCDRMIVVQGGQATESLPINEGNYSDIIRKYGYYLKIES